MGGKARVCGVTTRRCEEKYANRFLMVLFRLLPERSLRVYACNLAVSPALLDDLTRSKEFHSEYGTLMRGTYSTRNIVQT